MSENFETNVETGFETEGMISAWSLIEQKVFHERRGFGLYLGQIQK